MNVVEELTEMYEDRYDDLVRIYKSRAGANDVEDLVQEGFYRALKYSRSYQPNLVLMDTWFRGIMENCLRDLNNEKRNGSSMHNNLKEDSAIYDMPVESDGFVKALTKEVEKKTGRLKDVLYFYFMMGYSPSVIDKIVGTTSSKELVRQFKQSIRCSYPEYANWED